MDAARSPHYDQMVARQQELLEARVERERRDAETLDRIRTGAAAAAGVRRSASLKRRVSGRVVLRWTFLGLVFLGINYVIIWNAIQWGGTTLTVIASVAILWLALVLFVAFWAFVIFLITDGGPTDPEWIRHRHCGDWLHGGQCPDPSWHRSSRTGRQLRDPRNFINNDSAGGGTGNGY